MDNSIIEVIIQAGAVGLAIFSMFIVWKLASNHINQNTKVLQELKDAIRELTNHLRNGRK